MSQMINKNFYMPDETCPFPKGGGAIYTKPKT